MKEKIDKFKAQAALLWAVIVKKAASGWAAVEKTVAELWASDLGVAARARVREFADNNRRIIFAVYLGLVFVLLVAVHSANAKIADLKSDQEVSQAEQAVRVADSLKVITEQELLIAELQDKLASYKERKIARARTKAAYRQTMMETEQKYNIPPTMLYHIARVESDFNPDAVSHAGAVGLMQIVPRWHPDVDATDPHASIRYAGKYLHQLYKRFGTWGEALAAYNWGPTNLEEFGLFNAPPSTHDYMIEVMASTYEGAG